MLQSTYGCIGFLSHVLTYYTVGCLVAGRRPLQPCTELDSSWFNIILAGFSLCGTLGLTIFAMVCCENEW
jgi:hypothetical protein